MMAHGNELPLTTVLGDFNLARDVLSDLLPMLPPHDLHHPDLGETTDLYTQYGHWLLQAAMWILHGCHGRCTALALLLVILSLSVAGKHG